MIEKMKFLSITGPQEDFDRLVEQYLSKYEIHLENALSELKTVKDLRPFIETNTYKGLLANADEYSGLLPNSDNFLDKAPDVNAACSIIQNLNSQIFSLQEQLQQFAAESERLNGLLRMISPFRELQYNLKELLKFRFIRYRFGRISLEHYKKFSHFEFDNIDSIFYKCHADSDYVWGVYFVPESKSTKIDAIFSSLHFERIYLPDEYEGTPMDAYYSLTEKLSSLSAQTEETNRKITDLLEQSKDDLLSARKRLKSVNESFDLRKLAACTKEGETVFFIICGWMTKADAEAFTLEIENDEKIYCIEDEDEEMLFHGPPTKLKNPKIIRPFEMFTKMYGLPCYNEMDPTIFIALTYTLIFGIMFGDVGQGLFLVIGGFLLYRLKKINLAAILSCAGIFSTIFGFLFGSVFGFETIVPALWLHPRSNTIKLPLIGEMNTIFVITVAFGMGLIFLTMVFHIINAIKARNIDDLLFDHNGISGLVFYASAIVSILLVMTGKPLPAAIILLVMFVLPLILIALKEPLCNLITRRAKFLPAEKGMYVVQTFFLLFEILLSYFSNTLSFIRIGAFAVSHAAMMEVVLTLAGAEAGGSPNWLVIVFGNIFVCGLEGLIVGIQVLRLEYYEMFSRFYKGTGREFEPYKH